MDTLFELASFTDSEAQQCLNRILSGFQATNPDLPITSSSELASILKTAAPQITGDVFTPANDSNIRNRARAVRLLLLEFLSDEQLNVRLQAALTFTRPELIEPITTALVMAGIVIVLQTKFKLKYRRDKDKKSEIDVSFEKEPSSESLVKKILALF
jgi:hypothetical protein